MKDWKRALISTDATMRAAIGHIDESSLQIAMVVDVNGRLLGTVTDGDVRRGILRGLAIDAPVTEVMNRKPTTAQRNDSREHIVALMRQRSVHQVPVLDSDGRVTGLEVFDEVLASLTRPNTAILMAGGLGTRLHPLTENLPKPMLKVGGRPILETILQSLIDHGITRFQISVNFRAEMIKHHFGDGSAFGVKIDYLEETERLGTAGALSLLPQTVTHPVIVMNGDVLTKVNFQHLLDFHSSQGGSATMCVREHEFQIPFGVVALDNQRVTGIEEKPVKRMFVSAGIYVLAPTALSMIPTGKYFDMPMLFERLIASGDSVSAFPIREYWLDIGRMDDFERAVGEYGSVFK